ncbi:amidase [Thioclava sp. GXIMD2076]|uniref:amidase n=1 Tax=Thioclava sp. GXIMD2076 TaxID=3131931 RepID=UPI0030CF6B6C
MTNTTLTRLPEAMPDLTQASADLQARRISAVELLEQALGRIGALDSKLHAFIALAEPRARAAALNADLRIARGEAGPLTGIPYALKDIYDVAGMRTTAHSKLRLDHMAEENSDAADRLDAAGMVFLGKLSTHEFARGGPTDLLPFPNAKNAWNTGHFAGGSSSGSGVAVASGMVGLAMGTDTGGSIRLPAACNGIVGLKPTYGRLSRRGIVPLSFSMDHAGPLTRTVADCALAMQALAGHDANDAASSRQPVPDYSAGLSGDLKGLTIGRAREFDALAGVGPEQMAALDAVEAVLEALGARIIEVSLPERELLDAMTWAIIQAEGVSIHGKDLRERPEEYGRTTRERLMMGAFATGGHYVTAQRLRPILSAEVTKVLTGADAILCSPMGGPAPLVAEVDDLPWRKQAPLTSAFNGTGHPALVLPAGFGANGLPLSAQFVGRPFDEAMLLRIGHAYEQMAGWVAKRPAY